jgi:16S rRNA (cytidine1402-2'-O)-methyltransferase
MGTLYIIATPIGNLKDLSIRAIEVLTRVQMIACEDTRVTGFLLRHISSHPELVSGSNMMAKPFSLAQDGQVQHNTGKTKPILLSYYEQNETRRIPQIINTLKNGLDVALVSDAGTPTISDPGFKLVRECVKHGVRVESIPGPSAVISALVVSGLPTDKFLFLGYLPKKEGKRKNLLIELKCFGKLKEVHPTIILYESPYRLLKTLSNLNEVFADIDIVIARELTKMHEEIRREKISESIDHFSTVTPKGEFVILFRPDIF